MYNEGIFGNGFGVVMNRHNRAAWPAIVEYKASGTPWLTGEELVRGGCNFVIPVRPGWSTGWSAMPECWSSKGTVRMRGGTGKPRLVGTRSSNRPSFFQRIQNAARTPAARHQLAPSTPPPTATTNNWAVEGMSRAQAEGSPVVGKNRSAFGRSVQP